ncbi:LPS export ABC transporter periplasmic protein LptC [Mucilaginibacter sp. CSA2-8R]|uniref:LPS export ABC transporter periplasmic protein LptC n=1 Tax=Mucilaginibacter sp. CSA2-8R TaxID=3141542 RepID=UPI00315D0A7E
MTKLLKHIQNIKYRLALVAGLLLFSACENSLKDIQKISAQEVSKPISTTTGLDVTYSDSAKVQFRLTAPLLLDYIDKKFKEMPKGLKIIKYETTPKGVVQTAQITADYGIMREGDKLIELRRNVVATNQKGDVFKSEELFWDQGKRQIYSNKLVQLSSSNGTNLYGTGASTNESMYPWIIKNTTGQIPVNQNFGQ